MLDPASWITLIEFAGALLIAGHCLAGLVELVRTRDPAAVRLLVIQGSLWGLSVARQLGWPVGRIEGRA